MEKRNQRRNLPWCSDSGVFDDNRDLQSSRSDICQNTVWYLTSKNPSHIFIWLGKNLSSILFSDLDEAACAHKRKKHTWAPTCVSVCTIHQSVHWWRLSSWKLIPPLAPSFLMVEVSLYCRGGGRRGAKQWGEKRAMRTYEKHARKQKTSTLSGCRAEKKHYIFDVTYDTYIF